MNLTKDNIIQKHIQSIGGFQNTKIIEYSEGYSKLEFKPSKEALNVYGNLHGGVLFTLCDIAAAISCLSYDVTCVTLNSTINYIKGSSFDNIIIESNVIHKGKTTYICNVTIKNSNDRLLTQATFTMFNTGPIQQIKEFKN